MSVTPTLCITLADWLGRGVVTCAATEMAKHKMAKKETEFRFRELMVFLLVMGLPGMIYRKREIANCELQLRVANCEISPAKCYPSITSQFRISQFSKFAIRNSQSL